MGYVGHSEKQVIKNHELPLGDFLSDMCFVLFMFVFVCSLQPHENDKHVRSVYAFADQSSGGHRVGAAMAGSYIFIYRSYNL